MMTEEEKQILEWASMLEGDEPENIETDSDEGSEEEAEEGSYRCQEFMDVTLADDEGDLEFEFKKVTRMLLVGRYDSKLTPNRLDWDFHLYPLSLRTDINLLGKQEASIFDDCRIDITTSGQTLLGSLLNGEALKQLGELVNGDHFPADMYDSTDMSEVDQYFAEALRLANAEFADWTEDPVLVFDLGGIDQGMKLTVWFEQPEFGRKVLAAPRVDF